MIKCDVSEMYQLKRSLPKHNIILIIANQKLYRSSLNDIQSAVRGVGVSQLQLNSPNAKEKLGAEKKLQITLDIPLEPIAENT